MLRSYWSYIVMAVDLLAAALAAAVFVWAPLWAFRRQGLTTPRRGWAITVLGLFFPSGLRVVAVRAPEFTAWAWGINAGFTVLRSIGTIVLALGAGFSRVLVASAALYMPAAVALAFYTRAEATRDKRVGSLRWEHQAETALR